MRAETIVVAAAAAVAVHGTCPAQTGPVNGMRPAELRTHAVVGGTVVTSPGTVIDGATILIRDGVIEAVGAGVPVPPEARVWDADGLTIYAGLIEPALLIDVKDPPVDAAGAHWNSRVHPQVSMADLPGPDESLRKDLRELGFAAAAVYPADGVFRGTGAVIALGGDDEDVLCYRPRAAMAVGLEYGGRGSREYPRSLMGAIALIRQTLYDARWHAEAERLWALDPDGKEPPMRADALVALADVVGDGGAPVQALLFEVGDEHQALQAARIAREFDLQAVLLGGGTEFRRLDDVAAAGLPVIAPLEYPKRPSVSSLLEADDVSLREMMTWEQAPTNPRRLAAAGVTLALTTHRLQKRKDFHEALRNAVRHGLAEEQALAALTTTPARLLGLEDVLGTIEPGKAANLVVVDGSLFDEKAEIRDVWVNGRRHEITKAPKLKLAGRAILMTSTGAEAEIEIDTTKPSLSAHLPAGGKAKADSVVFQHDRLSFVLDGRVFEVEGYVRMAGVLEDGRIAGSGTLPDGTAFDFVIEPASDEPGDEPEAMAGAEAEGDEGADDSDEDGDEFVMPPDELVYPLGAYGLAHPPAVRDVLITNATIWTCGPDGIIHNGHLLVEDGRIVSVGPNRANLRAGRDILRIDAAGRHVTPGLIDCHSHTGMLGGTNEMGETITAEVRVADIIDPDDIGWYRELAGGLTVANVLHGSGNPIGGQNCVVKLRWSQGADAFPVRGAPGGIKFALGENVKRTEGRYPDTRMGVEAIIRDEFVAARDYQQAWARYRALPPDERARAEPPRRDLELDAIVEVLEGERLVHCHSYRQDEILMLIRLADEFGFTIGTFQHVLEGYKVADAIAAHGAGASTFSDWWAYKVEVMDAIPYNGALMHDVGVLVSFNSDSGELARRLNTEAAKAVRYGGIDPAEALEFVTINPARQLRIDRRTGSLERGKDADFVIWSQSPLSTYARCEQTWIDGAPYFDLETDRALRARVDQERGRLIQKILVDANGTAKPPDGDDAGDAGEPAEDAPGPAQPEPGSGGSGHPYSCCWSDE